VVLIDEVSLHVHITADNVMRILLAPELEKIVRRGLDSGRYDSAEDVVSAGLRALEAIETLQQELNQVLRLRFREVDAKQRSFLQAVDAWLEGHKKRTRCEHGRH
jgi:putative addiction module CopG family antidote